MRKLLLILLPIALIITFLGVYFRLSVRADGPPSGGVNIDPNLPQARPTAQQLKNAGVHIVRMVYKSSSSFDYISLVKSYNDAGIKTIMILNQETLYPDSTSGNISQNYVAQFGTTARQVAQKFGNTVTAYEIWNEADRTGNPSSIYLAPQNYASLMASAYDGIRSVSTSKVLVGGLLTGQVSYLETMSKSSTNGIIAADGIAIHPYTIDLAAMQNTIANYISAAKGKPIWITEFGWETTDQTKQAAYLVKVFELAAQYRANIAAVLWYGWSDVMNSGFGLIDKNGNPKEAYKAFLAIVFQDNPELLAYLLSQLPNFEIPLVEYVPPPIPHPELVCSAPGGVSPSTFRPEPCENCGYNPVNPAGGYATTATIWAAFQVPVNSLAPSGDPVCGGDYQIIKDWSGTFTIDTSENKVPFVGFGESDKMINEVDRPLIRYLSDYFDGTALYDGNGAGSDPTDPNSMMDMTNRSGVLRKLMPQELQDQTRRKVLSGQANPGDPIPIGKYTLKTKLDNSQNNETLTANMSDFTGDRIKPLRSDFPMTEDGYAQYKDKLDKWFKLPGGPNNTPGYWAALWSAIPLTTRQDMPGEFDLSIQGPPGQISGATEADPPFFQAAFPHLGRLFELLSFVSNIFTPGNNTNQILGQSIKETNGTVAGVSNTKPSAANKPNGKVLGQDITECEFATAIQPGISGGNGSYSGCFTIKPTYLGANLPPDGRWGTDWGYYFNIKVNGKIVSSAYNSQGTGRYIYDPVNQWSNCGTKESLHFSAPPGANVSFGVTFDAGQFNTKDRPRSCLGEVMDGVNASLLDCKIGADGKPDLTTCTTNGPVPPTAEVPVCGNKIFYTPPDVSDLGMSDNINQGKLDIVCTNPNPITARVTVRGDKIIIPFAEVQAARMEQALTGERQFVVARTSRRIGIGVQIPYLDDIWSMLQTILKTREPSAGIDSIVAKVSESDVPAKVPVSYGFVLDPTAGGSSGVSGPGSKQITRDDKMGVTTTGGNSQITRDDKVLAVTDDSSPGGSRSKTSNSIINLGTNAGNTAGGGGGEGFIYYPHLGSAACSKIYILKTVWAEGISDPFIDRLWEDCKSQISGLK